MSRSSFSKAYEEIANLEPMEMTFTIEDADLDKLNDVLKDINVRECPWFEVQDKHGNKAKYYREQRWIPCSERLPEKSGRYLVTRGLNAAGAIWNRVYIVNYSDLMGLKGNRIFWQGNVGKSDFEKLEDVLAWLPLPEPYREDSGE